MYYNPPYNTSMPYNGRYDRPGYYSARNAAPGAPQYPLGPPPDEEDERDDPFVPPVDGKPPSYMGDGYGVNDDKEDPFNVGVPERDVTSQPTPVGRDRFPRA